MIKSKYRILALRIILGVSIPTSAHVSLASEQVSFADEIDRVFNSYTTRTPLKENLKGEKSTDFVELQDYLIMKLMPDWGSVVGYLIGELDRGDEYTAVFLENMVTSSGARLNRCIKCVQTIQVELLIRLGKDYARNQDPRFLIANSIEEIIPAVLVRDHILPLDQAVSTDAIVGINAGIQYLILGQPLKIQNILGIDEWDTSIRVKVHGIAKDSVEGNGLVSMSRPLDNLSKLESLLKKRGRKFRVGDLLALGSLTPVTPLDSKDYHIKVEMKTVFGNSQVVFAVRSR